VLVLSLFFIFHSFSLVGIYVFLNIIVFNCDILVLTSILLYFNLLKYSLDLKIQKEILTVNKLCKYEYNYIRINF